MPEGEHTHVAPAGQPVQEFFTELLAVFRSMDASLAVIAGRQGRAEATHEPSRDELEDKAMEALLTCGSNLMAIQRKTGIPRSTLRGYKRFMAYREQVIADEQQRKRKIPRGLRTKEGNLEAWSDGE